MPFVSRDQHHSVALGVEVRGKFNGGEWRSGASVLRC